MNVTKTKVISNSNNITDVDRGNHSKITVLDEFVCLGQRISFDKESQTAEIFSLDGIHMKNWMMSSILNFHNTSLKPTHGV